MRTSVEISDALLARARKVMAHKGVTLRALVEEGLRQVLRNDEENGSFELRDARFPGETGFVAGVSESDVSRAVREFNEGRLHGATVQ